MRRKINRMLSFGLALIMMFSIAGCGSNAQPQYIDGRTFLGNDTGIFK